jgi:outer membrane protein OmpA-like peptidoglycan-associated protein
MRRRIAIIGLAVLLPVSGACDRRGEATTVPDIALDAPTVATPGSGSVADRGASPAAPDGPCAPGPGKRVTRLPDVVIPAIDAAEVRVDDVDLAGTKVPGFTVPAVHLPRQVIDAGCRIDHDAPGGCLGAVEITSVEVPDVEIPGFTIPAVSAADDPYEGRTLQPQRARGDRREARRADQVCQVKPISGGKYVAGVFRQVINRTVLVRGALTRSLAVRPRICVHGTCTDPVIVDALIVGSVVVGSVVAESAVLDSYTLGNSLARRLRNDQQTAYVAPADVLFDFDKATLKPEAIPTLRAIAADLAATAPAAAVRVEGHTDDVGEVGYNDRLSEDRARAVAAWLSGDGHVAPDRITTRGLGESTPAEPNRNPDGSDNPAGRATNRRVVISTSA